jgi:PAS domain S-box-containing protein
MDQSSIGIRISDKKGNNLYANQALLDIFGYENRAQIQIKQPQEFYSPECYAVFLQRHEKFLRGEQMPKRIEIDIIRKDGTMRNLQVSMMDVFWNGSIQYQTLYNDVTDLKQAEKALRESEEKYRLIVEKSTDIIFSFNAAGEFLYISPSIKNLLGYDPNDLIGHPFQSLIHPDDFPILQQAIQRNIKDGSQAPGGNRFRVRNASGEWRWHSTTGNAEYDANGKFEYFIAISRDITEHKKAEELLQATEQNFRNSLDGSPMGIRIIDSERRNLYVNQEFLNIFGYKSIGEVGGYPLQDHYTHEEHLKFLSRQEKRTRGERIPENMRVEIKSKNGIIRYLEVSDGEVVWDDKPHREIIYKDVTESELSKRALQESEERYRLIVENSTDIVFTLDTQGKIIYLSPSIKNVLGYEPMALIGVPFHSLVHPDDVHVIDEAELLHDEPGVKLFKREEYRFRDALGQWRWLSSTGTPMKEGYEKTFNFVGVARDITELKQAEKEKQALEEKAQVASRLAAIGEMAAGIAHEINNPLTGVIGFSQILLEKENVPEDIKSELIVGY